MANINGTSLRGFANGDVERRSGIGGVIHWR